MGLVDYSDSESDTEPVAAPETKAVGAKKPFQKVVDRSKPGKIVVSLPQGTAQTGDGATGDEPPAKKARTGTGAFSGFNSFLPAPKNANKRSGATASGSASVSGSGTGGKAPKPGVNLKTSATAGFSREPIIDEYEDNNWNEEAPSDLPKEALESDQKPAEPTKPKGTPLMFKPLSVARKPKKPVKPSSLPPKTASSTTATATVKTTAKEVNGTVPAPQEQEKSAPPAKKQKVSLFSMADDSAAPTVEPAPSFEAYEPMFEDPAATQEAFAQYGNTPYGSEAGWGAAATAPVPQANSNVNTNSDSLDAIASDLNLSATARRELFGRRGAPTPAQSAARVINFNTDREYEHNEELRAAGEQQAYNPVKSIAPGKHNLQQLVRQVHNQKDALEESFAKNKAAKNEAGARYGWR